MEAVDTLPENCFVDEVWKKGFDLLMRRVLDGLPVRVRSRFYDLTFPPYSISFRYSRREDVIALFIEDDDWLACFVIQFGAGILLGFRYSGDAFNMASKMRSFINSWETLTQPQQAQIQIGPGKTSHAFAAKLELLQLTPAKS